MVLMLIFGFYLVALKQKVIFYMVCMALENRHKNTDQAGLLHVSVGRGGVLCSKGYN